MNIKVLEDCEKAINELFTNSSEKRREWGTIDVFQNNVRLMWCVSLDGEDNSRFCTAEIREYTMERIQLFVQFVDNNLRDPKFDFFKNCDKYHHIEIK